jgi:hypothetical protein
MKISYRKRFSPRGCVYTQNIRLSQEEADTFLAMLKSKAETRRLSEAITSDNPRYNLFWLRQPVVKAGDIYFLNLTQRTALEMFLGVTLKYRNTCITLGN